MVEKRRSPAGDSPREAQRRKKLSTRPDGDASSPTPDASASASLVFRERVAVLGLDSERIESATQTDARGGVWRVLWQPRSPADASHVGVFVELVEGAPRAAELSIALLRHAGERPPLVKTTSVHAFARDSAEFGMSQFVPRAELLDPSNQFLTREGQAQLELRLSFVDDAADAQTPTQQQLLAYDSKQETGMVGLKNQGATCYLNSLLQTLFHLRAFRQVVYGTPTTQEDTNDSVSLALQRVFYRLQRQRKAVSTKELTRSFGWSQIDSFMQHDVQELYRILCDRLEDKMKRTRVDAAIPRLFEGKVRSFVQCVNVDFQSFRDESFYDLQLDVKGCKDLMQSFRKYVEVEMLDGDNQYEAEGHGKQDAKKGIKFLTFPPVLNIQLKRFEYEPLRDGMVKIHDRFEFPKTLVLDEFISNKEEKPDGGKDKNSRYTYHLHSVLVHSGDVHGGHYYVFIRPGKHIATSTDWFRSVDTGGVPDADGSHAVEEVYDYSSSNDHGSMPLSSGATNSLMLPLARNFSSAYMLVYVRDGENDISAIQDEAESANVDAEITPETSSASEDVSMADGETSNNSNNSPAEAEPELPNWQRDPLPIPEELVNRFHEEEKAAARRKKAQQTEHLYMNFRIASDTSVARLKRITKTMDFSSFNNSNTLRVRIKRAASIRQLCCRIYKETGVPMSRQRLWRVIARENRTTRPDQPVNPDGYDNRVDSLIEEDASPKVPVKLFLQILSDSPESLSQPAASPPTSPSSPSTHAHRVRRSGKVPATIHRHFWDEFTPPETEDAEVDSKPSQEMGEEDEDAAAAFAEASDSTTIDHAPPIRNHEILLFVKFYDLKRKLGERLEYMGNIVVDSRITGAELANYLHEALLIPFTTELRLYEEVQPMTVSVIDMETSLTAAEIQHGDIICFQYAEEQEIANGIVIEVKASISPESDNDSSALYTNGNRGPHSHGSAGAAHISTGKLHQQRSRPVERYPNVASYFLYLLDRVEVTLHRYGHTDEESFTLPLLLSNVYDEIIDAVAAHLGLVGPKRLFVRLYQHSPVNGLPLKTPLRHSRFSGDAQTTLEELLTEYLERTNILYYELLDHPITEIEAKKELFVHLSIYDACFATEQAASPSPVAPQRNIEVLVMPTHKVRDVLKLIRDGFGLPEDTALRTCEVVQQGTIIKRVLEEDASLSRYWGINVTEDPHKPEIMVEQIPAYELISDGLSAKQETTVVIKTKVQGNPEVEVDAKMDASASNAQSTEQQPDEDEAMSDDEDRPAWFYKGVVHFNFKNSSQKWIHPHGVPCVVRFSERDTVGDVKERIRQRMGISSEVFAQWNFALVKDLKASTLQAMYDDMEADALDAFPMSRLTELCGADFEGLGNLGLEHADPTPPPRHHASRRIETGIHIRQS
ncbi:putative ubiquitin-specific protease [Phytophthora cinnamomi]|uniref:putative ubiquitin-specific protease n=1 Tax=Phytophthora cinnamomi TaxID=4785 RepID=UPI00355A29D9|nr:putative ubiquitin-specific protease [Phytophthora cinnamomi]